MEKPRKFKKHKAGYGGWSEWVFPEDRYLFKCCDCDLVHEIEFKAFVETGRTGKRFSFAILPNPIRAMFRARRWKQKK